MDKSHKGNDAYSPVTSSAFRFGAGGAIAVLVLALIFLLQSYLLQKGGPVHQLVQTDPDRGKAVHSLINHFSFWGQLFGFAIGGALGGSSLGRGRKGIIGFGIGFLILGVVIPIVSVAPQGMSGGFGVLLIFPVGFAVGFGIAGAIGARISGLKGKSIFTGVRTFGIGGGLGGILSGFPFLFLGGRGLSDFGRFMLMLWVYVGIIAAYSIGGSLFKSAIVPLAEANSDEEG